MRHLLLLALISAGCSGGVPSTGGGDDMMQPDAGTTQRTCPLPTTMPDTGALPAFKAQLCNYPGSMGMQHWYRLSATLPGAPTSFVQIELYDKIGAFAGGTVRVGSFPVDTNPASCGVCVRAIGDKGDAAAREYFATGGTVNITALGAAGATIAATLSNVTFAEVGATHQVVPSGCTATAAGAQISGTVVQIGGTGGGGGGMMCSQNVGD